MTGFSFVEYVNKVKDLNIPSYELEYLLSHYQSIIDDIYKLV